MGAQAAVQIVALTDAAAPSEPPLVERDDVLQRLDKTAIGTRTADGAVSVRRSETPGCLLYGPYWQLPAGRYRLSFDCRTGPVRFPRQPLLGVEAIILNRVQHAWRDFTVDELAAGSAAVLFDVSDEVSREARNEGRFEFRAFHLGTADFTIVGSRLQQLERRAAAALPPQRWRLLGRLQTTWRAVRHGDGSVSARRYGPAGCLLYGGWPYLRLPRGRYRLRVEGDFRGPADNAAALLAVEIIGNSRWRDGGAVRAALSPGRPRSGTTVRREFSGQALRTRGAAEIEFDVPSELSLDSGTDAPFEIRVFRAGGGDIRIDAVDVHRLDGEPALGERDASVGRFAGSAPAVHPLGHKNVVIIGNCQSEIVRQGFTRVESLNRQFHAAYHFVAVPTNLYEFARRDLAACDILLVQDIRDWERFPLKDCIRPGVEPIRFPGVRFASLWPFDGWNGPGDGEAHRREAPNMTFAYLDGLLARLRREIPDPEQRLVAYRSLDGPGIVNYRRLHEFEERRLLAMDDKFGVEIGAYILEHFRRRRLFHTTVRPSREVLDLLMQFILRTIGVRGRHPLPGHVEALLRNPQVPVHPKVAADLGVRWADERTRYLHGGREVTWEAYIRSYIAHYG